ncbi:hypothetical protein M5K25_022615 [Dendrobium thyrsiflorum]|uniref:Uncharacterized protein n=1 Tax=Dendrobium thyrsiflorum TaxID=117978 RepID=A0ABD0UCR2_DENTH
MMTEASNPWGVAAKPIPAKPKGFFNLDSEGLNSPSRSFKEGFSGNTSVGEKILSLAHSSMNGVPAILLSDEEVAEPSITSGREDNNVNVEVVNDTNIEDVGKDLANGNDIMQEHMGNTEETSVEPRLFISVDFMFQKTPNINPSPSTSAPQIGDIPIDHNEEGEMENVEVEEGEFLSRSNLGRKERDQNLGIDIDGFTKIGKKKTNVAADFLANLGCQSNYDQEFSATNLSYLLKGFVLFSGYFPALVCGFILLVSGVPCHSGVGQCFNVMCYAGFHPFVIWCAGFVSLSFVVWWCLSDGLIWSYYYSLFSWAEGVHLSFGRLGVIVSRLEYFLSVVSCGQEDVQLLKELGMDAYRFSISWSRILAKGRGKVNKEGVQYYNNLINELLANGIEPYVTIFHWDLPEALDAEYGGFLSDKIAEHFKNYADVCFREFGDRVKYWITLNEALIFTTNGFGLGKHAPGHCTDCLEIEGLGKLNCPVGGDSLREPYIVAHNILRSHAETPSQHGEIGITQVTHWMIPIGGSPLSKEAQERALQFNLGWFMDLIKFGDYPLSMRALVRDILLVFTHEETKKLKNSYDFIGLNYYTSRFARNRALPANFRPTSYLDDSCVDITGEVNSFNIYITEKPSVSLASSVQSVIQQWKVINKFASSVNAVEDNNGHPIDHAEPGSWINVHPRGLRELLLYIKNRYDNPTIYITENATLEKYKQGHHVHLHNVRSDTHRAEYLALHLYELKEAIRMGVDARGYFTWSLIDNFQWSDGYTSRLGLYFIDYYGSHKLYLDENKEKAHSPPHLDRIPKQSVTWFKKFLDR